MKDREVWWSDYIVIVVVAVIALVIGMSKAVRQIPKYVKWEWVSFYRKLKEIQRYRVDGKTERDRYLEAMRRNRKNNE